MKLLKDFIEKQIAAGIYSQAMNDALHLIIENKMNSIALRDCLSKHDLSIEQLKAEAFSVVFQYANACLDDDVLSDEEMKTIGLLKLFFHIEEGDFLKYEKYDEVENILSRQLRKMYADDVIDVNEALQKTKLQELFGLNYDEFLEYVNFIAKESINRGADIKDLDTIM
ncbi:MAG: hypothetical protein E7069_11530 [Bacteroidales bacterium]|jgi:hypothetical protein|nr:hypothetical protein [Bacteroidales bacterium]